MLLSEAFDVFIKNRVEFLNLSEKTKINYQTTFNSVLRSIPDKDVEDFAFGDLVTWKADLDDRNLSDSTINSYITDIKTVFTFLETMKLDVISSAQILVPKITKQRPKTILTTEVLQLMNCASSLRDKALVALLYSTGCRISEVLRLNKEDVTGDSIIVRGKGGKYRLVIVDEATLSLVKAYLAFRSDDNPYLFPGNKRNRLTVKSACNIFFRLYETSGIKATPHVLRHTFATDMARNGASVMAVKDILGHAYVTTTQRYIHFTEHDLKKSYKESHTTLTENSAN